MRLLTFLLTTLFLNAVYASPGYPRSIIAPFENVPLFSDDNSGLSIGYSLSTNPTTELVCKMTVKPSALLIYRFGGGGGHTGTREGVVGSTFVLDPVGLPKQDHVWVVRSGGVDLYDIRNKNHNALVSCYYQSAEQNNKKDIT